MQLVIFDFCETLVNFQSADRFVDFIIEKEKYNKYKWLDRLGKILTKTRFLAVMNKFFPEFNASKRLKLLQVKGISNEKVERYAEEFYSDNVMPNLIKPIFELFQKHLQDKDYVLVISGGYAPYIRLFSEKHGIKAYFATEMAFNNGNLSGMFLGKDCLYGQKVVLLKKYLEENPIDYTKSIVYSDSVSDLPLLKWADEGVVISRKKSQPWAKTNGLHEIIHD
jgi:HAD superfamily hydrolase (TIGR01490 family)